MTAYFRIFIQFSVEENFVSVLVSIVHTLLGISDCNYYIIQTNIILVWYKSINYLYVIYIFMQLVTCLGKSENAVFSKHFFFLSSPHMI